MDGSDVDPVIWGYAQKGEDVEKVNNWVWSDLDGSDGVNLATDQLAIIQDNIYYFRVLDNDVQSAWSHGWYDGSKFSETVPYYLTVSVTEDPDSNEPANNEHNEAVSVTNGITTEGYIATEKDIDWYKIDAYAGQMINISASMEGNEVDLQITGCRKKGTVAENISGWLWKDYDGSDGVTINSNELIIPEDGTYYFKIEDIESDGDWATTLWDYSTTVPYSLTIRVSNNPDSNEPQNDEHLNAVQLTSGIGKQGYIATKQDTDWYKITAYAGQTLNLTVTMDGNPVCPGIYGYKKTGLNADSMDNWFWIENNGLDGTNIDSGLISITEDNTYYFRVYDIDWDGGYEHGVDVSTTVPYVITATAADNSDTNEPQNDEYTGAVQLTNAVGEEGYISTLMDIDWYTFDAYEENTVQITVTMNPNVVGPHISLYKTSGLDIVYLDGWNDENGEDGVSIDTGTLNIDEDNTYFIKIWEQDDEYSETPYTITVQIE